MKVFYSWQSDLENKYNRNFIKDCLERAINNINKDLDLEEAVRLDQDTKDVTGSPDIANTIYAKIRKSDVFVGDVSFIGKTESGKHCSNPNVLIELGYALSSLKDICIINLMNEAYGSPSGNLPFDLVHKRWPITYNLSEANSREKANIRSTLVGNLENAIKPILALRQANREPVPLKDVPSVDNIHNHILRSNPKTDWHANSLSWKSTVTYRTDVNLRIEINYDDEGVQQKNFVEPWANRFPDKSATGYWCDIYFGLSHIERTILVSVDGGRAMLPIPREQDEMGNYVVVKPFDYKMAEIFDTLDTLYQYLQRSGLKLKA
jgi:hypothetical protein